MKGLSAGIKVGILVLLMAVGGWLVWTNLATDPAGKNSYGLRARFRDASGLPAGSKVVVAGIPVGEIVSTQIDGRRAVVRFKIKKGITIYDSAIVYKKATSLLGNYYIEVDPGDPVTTSAEDGAAITHKILAPGDEVPHVVEATSPDQLLRRIEQSLPNVDEVLKSVRDLAEDMRRLVNGPVASAVNRVDALVQKEAPEVEGLIAEGREALVRLNAITKDVRGVTADGGKKINDIIAKLEGLPDKLDDLIATTKNEITETGDAVRGKLDRVDDILASADSIGKKIDDNQGTLGRLVNDPAIADNVEDITEDAKGFLGTITNLQTYVGLRSEYNVFAQAARHYVSVELHTRPDKFYLIEIEQGPRGDYPDVTLEYDPTVDPDNWIRKAVIADKTRFTFQFAKRFGWLTLRYGIKESTGGVGVDLDGKWWNRGVRLSVDAFDATFDQLPRVKVTAAVEFFRHFFLLGGVDELLNPPDTLSIRTGNSDVPIQFEEFRFGRDYFVGAMLRFNDEDLAALLAIGGSAIGSATK